MFTRFSAPRRPQSGSVAGSLVSLTTHAAIVVAVGGDLPARGGDAPAAAEPPPAGAAGEGVRWVGVGGAPAEGASRPGAPPPIAYVIPGRGPLREGLPEVTGPATARRPRRDVVRPGAAVPRPDPQRLHFDVPLPALPPAVDAAILVPGVIAAAPDLSRLPVRPEEFVRRQTAELLADLGARAEVRTTEALRPAGPVDVLPIALVSNPRPAYPVALARAGVGGRVVVEFTIDSVGLVANGSLMVVESTDTLLTQAVRAVVPRLRFMPAQLGRHAVGVTVRQPFLFVVRGRH